MCIVGHRTITITLHGQYYASTKLFLPKKPTKETYSHAKETSKRDTSLVFLQKRPTYVTNFPMKEKKKKKNLLTNIRDIFHTHIKKETYIREMFFEKDNIFPSYKDLPTNLHQRYIFQIFPRRKPIREKGRIYVTFFLSYTKKWPTHKKYFSFENMFFFRRKSSNNSLEKRDVYTGRICTQKRP